MKNKIYSADEIESIMINLSEKMNKDMTEKDFLGYLENFSIIHEHRELFKNLEGFDQCYIYLRQAIVIYYSNLNIKLSKYHLNILKLENH